MIKSLQVDEEQKKLQNSHTGLAEPMKSPVSNAQRLDSGPDQPIQKMTPSASPLLRKNQPYMESKIEEPANPAVTPFQQSKKAIQFTGVISDNNIKRSQDENYLKSGNISLSQLKLTKQARVTLKFGPLFLAIMVLSFPFGILIAYISSKFDSGTFTFVNCWLLIVFYTLSLIQQLYMHKNGLCNYILSKTELDYWNEPKFVKIMWGIRIGLLTVNLCLTTFNGYTVLSVFIWLAILTIIDLICIVFIFYAIIPVSNKQLVIIKERVNRLQRLQETIKIPLSFQVSNTVLGIYQHGSEGNIYQSTIASQNYKKFVQEMEERQKELLAVASARNDKLTHDASDFVKKLTNELRTNKDSKTNAKRISNPGISPFDILVNYTSFFLMYCMGYPIFLYFALAYQQATPDYLPLLFFLYPFSIYVWKKVTLSFFTMKQYVDYSYESKLVMFGVSSYRIGTMSVQKLGPEYFLEFLFIKFACKILYYWIIVFGYYFNLEKNKQMYMDYIRGSVVDDSQKKNTLKTRMLTMFQSTTVKQVKERKQSVYEAQAQAQETPSFTKTAANWVHVDNIDNIKKALITKQLYGFVLQEVFEIVFALLVIVLSSILLDETATSQKWLSFDVTNDDYSTYQLQIGIEIIIEFAFCFITVILYLRQLKITNSYSFFQQIQSIIGDDGLKTLVYDYCFSVTVCFLIVANKFEIK